MAGVASGLFGNPPALAQAPSAQAPSNVANRARISCLLGGWRDQSRQAAFRPVVAAMRTRALRCIFGHRPNPRSHGTSTMLPNRALVQSALFPELEEAGPRTLPILGEQKDIVYHSTPARSVLNGPEVTGMGYWSVNPYVGCAFGCAYCYARYAHRYVMERASAKETMDDGLARDFAAMPPWLAFERHVFVKENAPALLRKALRHGSDRHKALVQGETIVIGTATDPYQPAERRYRVTRGILEVLCEHPDLSV